MIPCLACGSHVRLADRRCPHCGSTVSTTVVRTASAALLGLTLVGCSGDKDAATDSGSTTTDSWTNVDYGVTDTDWTTSDADTDADTDSDTDTDTDTDADSDTDTDADADTGTTGTPTGHTGATPTTPEPEYGVTVTTDTGRTP